ncbi:MAG: DUF4249 family protein [Flavobacteriales bacterium]|nr:DUF4249 family protein [Flavobacteriales bacterium]
MNLSIQHISPYLLCIALIFSACTKEESISEQFESKLVIDASLETGSPIQDIHAHTLIGNGPEQMIEGLEIFILSEGENILLSEDPESPGVYHGPAETIIAPETEYSLRVNYKETAISATTITPPSLESVQTSKDFLEVDIQGDLVFLSWDDLNEDISFNQFFYVIELVPEEDDPEAIMRFSGGGMTSTVVSYQAEATLSIDDFLYYGSHLIKVYAIDKQYEHLFAPQDDITVDGPTNIQGGYGYFLGVSAVQTSFEIR